MVSKDLGNGLSVRFCSVLFRLSEKVQLLWDISRDEKLDESPHHPRYPYLSASSVLCIRQSIEDGSFQFSPLSRYFIPKANKPGQFRPITQPARHDQIVMQAFHLVLEELFDPLFLSSSYGFRKRKGARTFLVEVENWVDVHCMVKADFVGCFSNINHELLLSFLRLYIKDESFIELVDRFLKAPILDKEGKSYSATEKGIPQGCSHSPILMNIFLHHFDKDILQMGSSLRYVRYADDFVIALMPGYEETVDFLISKIEKLLLERYKLSITTNVFMRGGTPIFTLGVLLSLDRFGVVHAIAPLQRIRRKLYFTCNEEKQSIRREAATNTTLPYDMRKKLILQYNRNIMTYLALYTCCENIRAIEEFLYKEMHTKYSNNLYFLNQTYKKIGLRCKKEKEAESLLSIKRIKTLFKKYFGRESHLSHIRNKTF